MSQLRKDKEGHPIVDDLDQVDEHIAQRKRDVESGALFRMDNGTIKVDHEAAADALINFISAIPNLDPWIKKVMFMRLGAPLIGGKRAKKMSHLAIALQLGMKEKEVKDLEKAGKAIANEWMRRVTTEEIIERGQKDGKKSSLINDTLNTI